MTVWSIMLKVKALLMYEIAHVSLCFLTGGTGIVNAQSSAQ